MDMKTILPVFIFLFLMSCSSDGERELTFAKFERNLKQDISYPELVLYFGKPIGDIGSGIHIYVYVLSDDTRMFIGYTDQVIYAKHVSADGQLLHELI